MTCPCTLGRERCDCGLADEDRQIASDFAELEGERILRSDRLVNWLFTVFVMAVALWAVVA